MGTQIIGKSSSPGPDGSNLVERLLSAEPPQISGAVAAIIDSDGELLLPRHEATAFPEGGGISAPVIIDTGAPGKLPELVGDAQVKPRL